jgi:hypothetical protein
MADSVFTAHVAIWSQVANEIGQLSLPKNESGQYTHANITQLKKGIERILKQQYKQPCQGRPWNVSHPCPQQLQTKSKQDDHRRRHDQHVQEGGQGGVHHSGYDGAP